MWTDVGFCKDGGFTFWAHCQLNFGILGGRLAAMGIEFHLTLLADLSTSSTLTPIMADTTTITANPHTDSYEDNNHDQPENRLEF